MSAKVPQDPTPNDQNPFPRAAAQQLLPLVYDELRRLAARRLAQEAPGQSLDATALVHEAYVRLAGCNDPPVWDSRGHFFAAAAEAMRRILVERARRRKRIKHGGELKRVTLEESLSPTDDRPDSWERILAVDEALSLLKKEDPLAGELVTLHYFGGLPLPEVAKLLGMSRATAYRQWSYARAWLKATIEATAPEDGS